MAGFPQKRFKIPLHPPLTDFNPPARPSPDGKNNQHAWVAQLVEQLAFNQLVLGSNPSPRTSNKPPQPKGPAVFLFPTCGLTSPPLPKPSPQSLRGKPLLALTARDSHK